MNQKTDLPAILETDMTESELAKVNKFIEDGLPGIANVTDVQIRRMLDMYLTGSTYTQISNALNLKKNVILYMSHHAKWYESKKEFLNELQEKQKNRVIESKIRSQDFMLLLIQSMQRKISHKLSEYLATGEEEHMDGVDLKEVAQLMKAIEMINDLDSSGKTSKGKDPAIGLNVGNGVTIEKSGDNKISITPNENKVGDILQQYADSRREEEKKKLEVVSKRSDIVVEQGEKNDK